MIDEKALEERRKICRTCWSGQEHVVGRRCQGCKYHSQYEPINKEENKIRKLKGDRINGFTR